MGYNNYDSFEFAGVYNKHKEEDFSCLILITEANSFIAIMHNSKKRIPIILDIAYENQWLIKSLTDSEIKEILDNSFTKKQFEVYTVS